MGLPYRPASQKNRGWLVGAADWGVQVSHGTVIQISFSIFHAPHVGKLHK